MCDTLVILPKQGRNESIILAKNSDREPSEAQEIIRVAEKDHHEQTVKCTYINIPQVAKTNEVILSKPFHMWGAEMGVNEHGLAVGNEAVFTKVKFDKSNAGLTGMDLIRLALERCRNSEEAVKLITLMLEQYGQDACGGYRDRSFYYHNSFLIADPEDAWVLETAGREWIAKKVQDQYTLSNRLSLNNDYDLASENAMKMMKKSGKGFADTYSEWLYTTIGRARQRQSCTSSWISNQVRLSSADLFKVLQIHHLPMGQFAPHKANTADICMHATGLLNPSSTTGSMVAELTRTTTEPVWLTGTPYPCLSVWIPFYFGVEIDPVSFSPGAASDNSLWWTAATTCKKLSKYYQKWYAEINQIRQEIQSEIMMLSKQTDRMDKESVHQRSVALARQYWAEILDFNWIKS